jgi:LysR family transcriptional regulator, nitrogen assimilation regulatory protein
MFDLGAAPRYPKNVALSRRDFRGAEMRSRQLECFVCICETGSITRAAAKLNIAQPALGVQLRALEQEFGARLVTRNSAGTAPTAAGALFLDEARKILARLAELKRRLREIEDRQPLSVRVGMPASLTGYLTGRLLARVRDALPSLHLSIVEGPSNQIVEQVQSGRLDVAVAFEARIAADLTIEPILNESLCLIVAAGSRHAKPKPIELAALRGVDLTMPGEGDVVRRILKDTMRAHGMQPRIVYPVTSMPAMIDIVAEGLACAVLPAGAVAREMVEGKLIARPIVRPDLKRTLSLVRGAEAPAAPEFTKLCALIGETLRQIGAENEHFELFGGVKVKPAPRHGIKSQRSKRRT